MSNTRPLEDTMKGWKLLLAVLVCAVISLGGGMRRARQCRIEQLTSGQPNKQTEYEGGMIEHWDDKEEQFQCGGVSAMRLTIRTDSLALPTYHSSPSIVYVDQGEAVIGMSLPGCPETYPRDMHQPTRRIRKGHSLTESFTGLSTTETRISSSLPSTTSPTTLTSLDPELLGEALERPPTPQRHLHAALGPAWATTSSMSHEATPTGRLWTTRERLYVFDDMRMNQGDMVVVPQFYISTCRAGTDGFDYLSFKTTSNSP